MAWLGVLGIGVLSYLHAARRQHRLGRGWSRWRTAAFLGGACLVALGAAGPLAMRGHHDLRWHMAQHLLIGMFAPLGLVLAAPVTLLLRSVPRRWARMVTRTLRTDPARALGHPLAALVLNLGGMCVLYGTPLYAAMLDSAVLHQLVHVHFLLAGCLFTWSIAGPDPAPHRPSPEVRLAYLFVSLALHGSLAKLMYARLWPRGTFHSVGEIHEAAQWMYYGGDLAEVLLAVALFASWPNFVNVLSGRTEHRTT